MSRVLFLPDFGTEVGGGHVMRCLTLARELIAQDVACGFCVLPEAEAVIRTFAGEEVEIVPRDWAAGVAVIDGYAYTADHERALAAEGRKVCAIDDLGRMHDCDLVTDSEIGRTPADYPGRAKVLAGPRYALVRPEFVDDRDGALARRAGGGKRVLVSLGLTDVGGITERVLKLMQHIPGWDAIDVVLGSGARSLVYAEDLASYGPKVTLHVNTRDMAGLTARADIAVGAGGGSLWERAVLGLPSLVLVLAENQAHTATAMDAAGAALILDAAAPDFDAGFAERFNRLINDNALRASLSAASAALCDGLGAQRVAAAIRELATGIESPRP